MFRDLMCGNVTLMGSVGLDAVSAFPLTHKNLLEAMLRVSQMRGAQSGGGAIQIEQAGLARQLIRKCVNSKRGDLANRLTSTLNRGARFSRAYGGTFIIQTHVRYATAGITAKSEAHPFRYVDVSTRGPRRLTEWREGQPLTSVRPVETALTHNGDMDGLRFRGVSIAYTDLGLYLEHVLGVKNRWLGDSPLLVGSIELFLARGMWFESLRLAYHLIVAPPPPDFQSLLAGLRGKERERRARELLGSHPSLPVSLLEQWERVAEGLFIEQCAAWGNLSQARIESRLFREELAERLCAYFHEHPLPHLPAERLQAFARAVIAAFFDNDLYVALRKLEPCLDGTFGCVVTSTLEPGCLVAFSRGQPLSLGFQHSTGTVSVVSERSALKVRTDDGRCAFDERLDLDLCRGEIARVEVDASANTSLTLYGISDGNEYDAKDLVRNGRLVPLEGNPYVSPLPVEATDRLTADIQAIPQILRNVRDSWQNTGSHNRETAEAFVDALFARKTPRLLLLGITNDLWLGEQFVTNLKVLMPGLEASARSSNEILAEEPRPVVDENTVVLAISQTGQDFPTLGALLLLQASLPEKSNAFFVMTGEIDTLMGQSVGQSYAPGAGFSRRIFSNLSGFRVAEAAIATVSAMQHSLSELLLRLAHRALELNYSTGPLRIGLSSTELERLEARRDATVDRNMARIIATDAASKDDGSNKVRSRLVRRWSLHVLDGIFALGLALCVLELNLRFNAGILPSALLRVLPEAIAHDGSLLSVVLRQVDVVFYVFLAPLLVWLVRALTRRPLLHRHGVRELLIGDTRYVHKIAWLCARKLFSLSYGFASLKPYSADAQDELIMTHEPTRGTLVLLGLPDTRRAHLSSRAAAAFMTAKQFNNSRSLAGSGAEIVTVGHAPARDGSPGFHLQLPFEDPAPASRALDLAIEGMFDSWERLLGMQVFLDRVALSVSRWAPLRYDRSKTKDQVYAPTTAAPVSAAAIYQLLSRTSERYEGAQRPSLPFEVVRSEWRGSAPKAQTAVWRRDGSDAA